MTKLIYGIGINDAPYKVQPIVQGKRDVCPFYRCWFNMFVRCYSDSAHLRNPTYLGCGVDSEWHRFMAFREWMISQDWKGNELDKDLLFPGNKIYGSEKCIFVSSDVNKFMTNRGNRRSEWGIGVRLDKKTGRFIGQCHSLGKGQEYLGSFGTAHDAHVAYLRHKRKQAYELSEKQSDYRVKEALLKRYSYND